MTLPLPAPTAHDLHVIVPAAHPGAAWLEASPTAWASLATPQLATLLRAATWSAVEAVSEDSPLSVPDCVHLHAHGLSAREVGLSWPDAAWHSDEGGVQAWITPCHWHMAQGRTLMLDPHNLGLDEDRSRGFMQAMRPYFEEDGLHLHWHDPLRWRLSGPALRAWTSMSLPHMVGRDVQAVLQAQPWPAPLGRLHIEMQMLLYTHALNEAQIQASLPSVNSFWVHGVGEWPASKAKQRDTLLTINALEAALQGGAPSAWLAAWGQLDGELAQRIRSHLTAGQSVQLHLCGEQRWCTARLTPASLKPSLWQRLWPLTPPQAQLTRRLQAL